MSTCKATDVTDGTTGIDIAAGIAASGIVAGDEGVVSTAFTGKRAHDVSTGEAITTGLLFATGTTPQLAWPVTLAHRALETATVGCAADALPTVLAA